MSQSALRADEDTNAADEPTDRRATILAAARKAFSSNGFNGASLRQIAAAANVQHQLVVYHFKTKDALWRAVVEDLVPDSDFAFLDQGDDDPGVALARLIRYFVELTAARPEFHRIVTIETCDPTDRLAWLIEHRQQPYFELSTRLIRAAQDAGSARPGDPAVLHYALIGLAATPFVGAIELEATAGIDPFEPEFIEQAIEMACDFIGIPEANRQAAMESVTAPPAA